MALTEFYLYPNADSSFSPNVIGGGGWTVNPTWSSVDDAFGAPDDANFGMSVPIGAVQTWAAEWEMSEPLAGVTITKIELFARLWAVSQNSTIHSLVNVKGIVTPPGGTRFYTGTIGVTGTTGAAGPNPATYNLGTFTTNPATAVAWTIPDLQALIAGVMYDDQDVGSNTPQTFLSQFYIKVTANTTAASIESVRSIGAHYLWLFREPAKTVDVINLPPAFADTDILDDASMSHFAGPSPSGSWGTDSWARRDLILLGRTINPESGQVTWSALDARRFRCSLWWSPYTDLGFTDEGNNVPYLDLGGGRAITRASKRYVRKQLADVLYAEAQNDKWAWGADGLELEDGGDHCAHLNNTFSQGGPGNVFTGWAQTVSGSGTIVEDTTDFLFDATGLMRSVKVSNGATVGSGAYVSQTVSINGTTFPYGRVLGLFKVNTAGTAPPRYRLRRSSDNFYWNNGTLGWQAGSVWNDTTNVAGVLGGYFSGRFALAAGAANYTFDVGYETGQNGSVNLYWFTPVVGSLTDMAAIRSPLVTTTATVTRVADVAQINNRIASAVWDPATGTTVEFTIVTKWAHSELADLTGKKLFECNFGGITWICSYLRTSSGAGSWLLSWSSGASSGNGSLSVSGAGLPTLFSVQKITLQFCGVDAELGKSPYQAAIFVNSVEGGAVTPSVTPALTADATINLCASADDSGDYVLRRLAIRPLVLTSEEIIRDHN